MSSYCYCYTCVVSFVMHLSLCGLNVFLFFFFWSFFFSLSLSLFQIWLLMSSVNIMRRFEEKGCANRYYLYSLFKMDVIMCSVVLKFVYQYKCKIWSFWAASYWEELCCVCSQYTFWHISFMYSWHLYFRIWYIYKIYIVYMKMDKHGMNEQCPFVTSLKPLM